MLGVAHLSFSVGSIDNASYEARCEATDGAPETAVAVLVYAIQYGINSELARDIRRWTKLVAGIKSQLGQVSIFLIPMHGDSSAEDWPTDTDATVHR